MKTKTRFERIYEKNNVPADDLDKWNLNSMEDASEAFSKIIGRLAGKVALDAILSVFEQPADDGTDKVQIEWRGIMPGGAKRTKNSPLLLELAIPISGDNGMDGYIYYEFDLAAVFYRAINESIDDLGDGEQTMRDARIAVAAELERLALEFRKSAIRSM